MFPCIPSFSLFRVHLPVAISPIVSRHTGLEDQSEPGEDDSAPAGSAIFRDIINRIPDRLMDFGGYATVRGLGPAAMDGSNCGSMTQGMKKLQ
jgi:hypothetical protein